jgi:uncharacterized protein (DUF2252 family)
VTLPAGARRATLALVVTVEGTAVKRLALLALLLASSSVVAAPAPLPKPQRKPERPAARQARVVVIESLDVVVVVNLNVQPLGAPLLLPPLEPAQPPNADPPG